MPWKKVNELLIAAANKTEGLDRSTMPFVRQDRLADFYIIYELKAFSQKPNEMPHTYSEIHKNILEEFDAAGIEILSPHYKVERDRNISKVSKGPDSRNT